MDTKASPSSTLTEPLLSSSEDPLLLGEHDNYSYSYERTTRSEEEEELSTSFTDNKLSKNVKRILALTWFSFTGRSIWSQSVLSMFVFLMQTDHPERVGYVTATMGLSQVIASIPASRLAKSNNNNSNSHNHSHSKTASWKRNHILRLGALVGAGAVGLTAYAIYYQLSFYYLMAALSTWGVMWGITGAALPSLFSDSIPEECHGKYYKRGSRIIRSSNFLGPFMALTLFWYLGNTWTIWNCSIVMGAGLGLCVPVLFILCCLTDDEVEDHHANYATIESPPPPPQEIHLQEEDENDICCKHNDQCENTTITLACEEEKGNDAGELLLTADIEEQMEDENQEDTPISFGCCKHKVIVPVLIAFADILSGIASGMSIRYFPVFFASKLGLSPTYVQVLYMVAPLGQAVTKWMARGLSRIFGASVVSVMLHWVFVALLGSMLHCYLEEMSLWIVCGLYVAHASLMNSTCALSRAILWSAVPEDEIQKWTVADTIQLLLWSGGAALGGVLVGYKGIIFNFYVTAALQLLATVPLVLLCCFGPSKDRVNEILFPQPDEESDYLSSMEESHETVFEETRDFVPASESDSSEFFDCSSIKSKERTDL